MHTLPNRRSAPSLARALKKNAQAELFHRTAGIIREMKDKRADLVVAPTGKIVSVTDAFTGARESSGRGSLCFCTFVMRAFPCRTVPPQPDWLTEPHAQALFAIPPAELLGYENEEVAGKKMVTFFILSSNKNTIRPSFQQVHGGKEVNAVFEVQHKDRNTMAVAFRMIPAGKTHPPDHVIISVRSLEAGHGTLTIDEHGQILSANDFVSLVLGCASRL